MSVSDFKEIEMKYISQLKEQEKKIIEFEERIAYLESLNNALTHSLDDRYSLFDQHNRSCEDAIDVAIMYEDLSKVIELYNKMDNYYFHDKKNAISRDQTLFDMVLKLKEPELTYDAADEAIVKLEENLSMVYTYYDFMFVIAYHNKYINTCTRLFQSNKLSDDLKQLLTYNLSDKLFSDMTDSIITIKFNADNKESEELKNIISEIRNEIESEIKSESESESEIESEIESKLEIENEIEIRSKLSIGGKLSISSSI